MIKMMPLKQVCSGIIDCPHESPEWLSKGIPVIRNFNLVDGQIDMSDASYVDESTYTKRTRRAVPSAGDIIFSREAPIGNCAIVPADFKCCLGQRLVLLRVNREICSPEYLLAALLSDFVKTQIFQVEKSGSIVSNFNISDLGDLIIPIIDRQESVASVSDTLNKTLLINKNICAELEAMAKTLYDYWFTQFDFPDENGKPYRTSGGEMVWNDQLKREIPRGWNVGQLSDIANIAMGQSPAGETYNENGNGMIFYQGCTDFGTRFPVPRVYTTAPTRFAKSGDILMSVRAPVGTLNVAIEDCSIGRGLAALNSKIGSQLYLWYTLAGFKQLFNVLDGNGTTFGSITKDTLYETKVVIPNPVLVKSFEEIVQPIEQKIRIIEEENRELTKLRDWLLPMLMNGQAVVSD